jgi:hypothetical protein
MTNYFPWLQLGPCQRPEVSLARMSRAKIIKDGGSGLSKMVTIGRFVSPGCESTKAGEVIKGVNSWSRATTRLTQLRVKCGIMGDLDRVCNENKFLSLVLVGMFGLTIIIVFFCRSSQFCSIFRLVCVRFRDYYNSTSSWKPISCVKNLALQKLYTKPLKAVIKIWGKVGVIKKAECMELIRPALRPLRSAE